MLHLIYNKYGGAENQKPPACGRLFLYTIHVFTLDRDVAFIGGLTKRAARVPHSEEIENNF